MMSLDELEPAEKRYRAWVNNKVQALTLTIQTNRVNNIHSLLKHEFFLEEVEHHFMDSHAGHRVWRAFLYLKRYLKLYPHARANHQKGAMKMLELIYGQLGFDGRKISSTAQDEREGSYET